MSDNPLSELTVTATVDPAGVATVTASNPGQASTSHRSRAHLG